jgi:hypothetical protein
MSNRRATFFKTFRRRAPFLAARIYPKLRAIATTKVNG